MLLVTVLWVSLAAAGETKRLRETLTCELMDVTFDSTQTFAVRALFDDSTKAAPSEEVWYAL